MIEGITFYKIKDIERISNKKQLSHEMLQKNNLTNDTPEEIKEALRIAAEKSKFERALWKRQLAAREEQMQAALAKAAKAREANGTGLRSLPDPR